MSTPFVPVIAIGVTVWLVSRQFGSNEARKRLGVSITDGKPALGSHDVWMETAPELIRHSLEEGNGTPEDIVANLMRRISPGLRWPPLKSDPHFGLWVKMVQTVSSTLERPHVPQLKVI